MKRSILSMGKILLSTLLMLVFSIVIVLPIPVVTRMNPETTIYLDRPTINATVNDVGKTVTVNLMIRDARNIQSWAAGMIFNATLLNCTAFEEGEFLINGHPIGSTFWVEGTIDNAAGVITGHACILQGDYRTSGDGQLAYLNFTVKAPGVSDLHLRDVKVSRGLVNVPINIIDVYTAIKDAKPHTVVTVSNSTGRTGWYHSGFYDHAYNPALKELSFKVTGPYPGFSNVTIPKTLLNVTKLDDWMVVIDGNLLSTEERNVTENTHTSIYFTYSEGIHEIRITTRVSSTISIAFSSASITLGSNVTISGNITADDPINPLRPNVNVTIRSRPIGAITWDTIDTVKTYSNSSYTYTWTPETGGTHEVNATWEGDEDTIEAESDVLALTVLYVFEPVQDVHVVIETNSTVADFNSIPALDFSQPLKQISFNVTSPYGTIGYSNVTIPKTLLPPPAPPIEWKVRINRTLLSTEERTVTENDNTSIYFTYESGVKEIQITTRMSSTISMALSEDSIPLGSSVTISGNITVEDNTMRPNVTVTIQSRPSGDVEWTALDTVETDENGNYAYAWTPETVAIYQVMATWEGDLETLPDESDVLTLTVIESSTISIALSSTKIAFGSSVTISGAIDPLKPNVTVTIQYKPVGAPDWAWSSPGDDLTDQDGSYTFTWTVDDPIVTPPGTYEVRATWLGDDITYGATSNVLTLTAKWTSTISIALSSANITKGESVTISGSITAADNIARANVTATILYKLSGAANWTTLDTVQTDANGNYTYPWEPETDGIYEVMASWEGDDITFGNESVVLTLTVKEAPGIPLEIVVVAVVATIIIAAAIVVYLVRFRKPK